MSDKCFEIGTIQAFLDGETTPDLSFKISGHVADCDNCALALADAEEESSFVFSALDREFSSLVPTQRLWSSINEAITYEKAHTSFWDKVRVSLSTLIANPSLTVAASVLIVFGLFAMIWNLSPDGSSYVFVQTPVDLQPLPKQTRTADINITDGPAVIAPPSAEAYTANETILPADKGRQLVRTANYDRGEDKPKAQYLIDKRPVNGTPVEQYLPGEDSYVRTIADLKQNVDGQKDQVLNPSSRMAYERDMAVVNDAIKKMKEVVKKNPKNQSAQQVLYSSYQNKIDLLNSVVEREELMASLK